jgi:hypothetical protein
MCLEYCGGFLAGVVVNFILLALAAFFGAMLINGPIVG